MAEEQFVVFKLGCEEYAVAISQVREIIQYKTATRIPDMPDFMAGIINLRGKVIPTMELVVRFGKTAGKTSDRRAIIVEVDRCEFGIIVDEVTEVIRLTSDAIEPAPSLAGNTNYIRGIGKDDERLLIILDLVKVVGNEEVGVINNLLAHAKPA